MTIWNCKALVAAGAFGALAACEDGSDFALPASQSTALTQAKMLSGKITLVPPYGYCIDSRSLKQRFAIMARCDALNDDAGTGGAPIGIITASVALTADGVALPTAQEIATAATLQNLRDVSEKTDRVIFRADGAAPDKGYSQTQWRSAAKIGTVALGLTMHGPEKGRAISGEGRDILFDLIARTRKQTASTAS